MKQRASRSLESSCASKEIPPVSRSGGNHEINTNSSHIRTKQCMNNSLSLRFSWSGEREQASPRCTSGHIAWVGKVSKISKSLLTSGSPPKGSLEPMKNKTKQNTQLHTLDNERNTTERYGKMHINFNYLFIYLLKAYSPVNRTG